MGYIDDASGKREFQNLWAAVRKLQTMSPLDNSSVQGTTRFLGNESLKVVGSALVSGWLIVTGTLKIVGTLAIEGATNMTGNLISSGTALFTGAFTSRGTTRFEGDTTQQGALHVVGASDFTGNVLIDGLTTLKKRLTVTTPGDIRVEGAIPMTIGNAKVGFDSGGSVEGYAGGVWMKSGGVQDMVVSTGGVAIVGASGKYFTVSSGGHLMGGHATTTLGANVYIDSSNGLVSRVTSASRFKADQRESELSDAVLDVPIKDWLDSEQVAMAFALESAPRPWTKLHSDQWDSLFIRRVPGVIAEEVAAAGGDLFTTYDENGMIVGVAYDRLALARTQINARRQRASDARIAALESTVAELLDRLAG